ncbi:GNAT family N-acetyltransferase [Nocardioides sp.]|uniref:GNAT family N-acetyltransferase n=1 Tax=Nocardioides sp. TaxID=35761 RepID=UPI0031FE48BB|nr:GCN5-related N-acetyltransferase [Nocardioides sp.]
MADDWFELEFTEDPLAFVGAADEYLREDPVLTTVVATVTQRAMVNEHLGEPRPTNHPYWWVLVRNSWGQVVSAGMRTAPFAPHPLFVLPMADAAARDLARALHARGEEVGGVNGALPAALVIADELASLTGATASVHEHTRLFELGKLIEPPQSPGLLRAAGPDDLDLCVAWFNAFAADAAEQAGRSGAPQEGEQFERDDLRKRIDRERVWLWEDEQGTVVHLTGYNAPAYDVVRIGPVYTPREHRGRGYASATVATLSRRLVGESLRLCLFTDQANPTSNKIYRALGYEPVVDMVNMLVTTRAPA